MTRASGTTALQLYTVRTRVHTIELREREYPTLTISCMLHKLSGYIISYQHLQGNMRLAQSC